LVFGTNACRLLWVEKSWAGSDHHQVFLSFVGKRKPTTSLVWLLSSTLHFGMYNFIAYLCLYLFTVFVVAHVGQEGLNWVKGNNNVQKSLLLD
jgi:hypothetical protein